MVRVFTACAYRDDFYTYRTIGLVIFAVCISLELFMNKLFKSNYFYLFHFVLGILISFIISYLINQLPVIPDFPYRIPIIFVCICFLIMLFVFVQLKTAAKNSRSKNTSHEFPENIPRKLPENIPHNLPYSGVE